MKGLKKLALASAVAAAPFAQAELTAIDDSVLETMTGQDGVSIELSANVSVGKFQYSDNDGVAATLGGSATAGTFEMSNVVLGGSAAGTPLDGIKIDIDIDGTDGLRIYLGAKDKIGVMSGAAPVDFGLDIGSVSINDTATLASNIAIDGQLGPITVTIDNASNIGVDAYFEVTGGGMDIDVLGMGISNLTVGDNSNPFISNLDAGVAAGGAPTGKSVYDTAYDDYITNNAADPLAPTPAEVAAAEATAAGTVAATDNAIAQSINPALTTTGLSNAAWVAMSISTGATDFRALDGTVTDVANALVISIDAMAMDITADLTLGELDAGQTGTFTAASLGSIAIDDLDLSGTTLKIYGH